jgi:hypothetical protein
VKNERETRITLRITPAQAQEFFDRLGHDEQFREELTADPAAVLERYDITVHPSDAIPTPIELPSMEEIQEFVAQFGDPESFGTVAPRLRGYMFHSIAMKFPALPLIAVDARRDAAD